METIVTSFSNAHAQFRCIDAQSYNETSFSFKNIIFLNKKKTGNKNPMIQQTSIGLNCFHQALAEFVCLW